MQITFGMPLMLRSNQVPCLRSCSHQAPPWEHPNCPKCQTQPLQIMAAKLCPTEEKAQVQDLKTHQFSTMENSTVDLSTPKKHYVTLVSCSVLYYFLPKQRQISSWVFPLGAKIFYVRFVVWYDCGIPWFPTTMIPFPSELWHLHWIKLPHGNRAVTLPLGKPFSLRTVRFPQGNPFHSELYYLYFSPLVISLPSVRCEIHSHKAHRLFPGIQRSNGD